MTAIESSYTVLPEDVDRRVIEPGSFVADTEAFIDVRIPGSVGKASYSFIGPGVSQNDDQSINLTEPHGFNVGGAAMPHGVVNNPHLHYTAEVFICTKGSYRFFIGEHGEQHIDVNEGDVFSVPTWVFRGFSNTGPDDGFMFAVLGGDDTGGIIWAPHILAAAAETGLYLGKDYSIIEATNGSAPADVIAPLTAAELISVDSYSDAELQNQLVRPRDLDWADHGLLSSVLENHDVKVAPVIGRGISEHRRHLAQVMNAHGFSAEWLKIAPGSSTGFHQHDDTQVMFLVEGDFELSINRGSDLVSRRPSTGSIVSVPAGSWRDLRNAGSTEALALVVCGGDARTVLNWDEDIVAAAGSAGYAIDANGYVAPTQMLGLK